MKKLIKKINRDKIIKLSSYISFGLVIAKFTSVAIFYNLLPPYIPVYNQMLWGDDRISAKIEIFIPIFLAVSFLCVNLFISLKFYDKAPLLSRIMSIAGLLISMLTFMYVIKTIKLIV